MRFPNNHGEIIMGISEFRQLEDIFLKNGVNQIYVKELAPKQDNDKNQIYIGKISSNLPGTPKGRGASKSNLKKKDEPRNKESPESTGADTA